jgi:tRNA pseudouridine38-40 synthase
VKLVFTLEYNGKYFSGFQKQANAKTIQEEIENSIYKITQETISINYAGRTDAGVHAISQVFDFETSIDRKDHEWIDGINSNLPRTIKVTSVTSADSDFHSRFSALDRTYAYVIYNSKSKPIFFDDFTHWEKIPLDLDILQNEGSDLIGKHDFSSFRSSSCSSNNPTKVIKDFRVEKLGNFLVFHITANAFLHNMVRIIMGTIVDIAKNENKLNIKQIIDAKDRIRAGRTLSAKALFFLGPAYKDVYNIPKPTKNLLEKFRS